MSRLDEFFTPELKSFIEDLAEYVLRCHDCWISVKKRLLRETYDIIVEVSGTKKVKVEDNVTYIYLDDAAPDITIRWINGSYSAEFGAKKYTLKDVVIEVEPYIVRLIMYGVRWKQ